VVEGEIYSKSLTIEHEAQFEGVSRRLDKPVDAPLRAQATMPATIPLAPSMTEAGQSGAVADKIEPKGMASDVADGRLQAVVYKSAPAP
jgi:hypothetical protein